MSSVTPAETVHFDMRLIPHRSLSRRGCRVLLTSVGTVSLGLGTLFWLRGAWPVIGFMGLDVLLLWVALRVSYARARAHERVRLTDAHLIVERIAADGATTRRWDLQPTWLRVELNEPVGHDSPVRLWTHGQSLEIGLVLAPEPRLAFARKLRQALADWRHAPLPA